MIVFVLALATYAAPTPVVDRVEVNYYYDEKCERVHTQLIFWQWSEQRKRYDVRGWKGVKDEEQYPVRTAEGYRVVWYEGEHRYEVRAKSRCETHTTYDPELCERENLHQNQRKPLFKE